MYPPTIYSKIACPMFHGKVILGFKRRNKLSGRGFLSLVIRVPVLTHRWTNLSYFYSVPKGRT